MKALLMSFVVGAFLLAGGQADDAAAKKERARLQGSWTVVKFETPEKELDDFRGAALVFADQSVELRRGGETKKGTYKIDPAAKPRRIELTPEDGTPGMHGIYRLEKDRLQIAVAGRDADAPTEFAAKGKAVLITLERDKK